MRQRLLAAAWPAQSPVPPSARDFPLPHRVQSSDKRGRRIAWQARRGSTMMKRKKTPKGALLGGERCLYSPLLLTGATKMHACARLEGQINCAAHTPAASSSRRQV